MADRARTDARRRRRQRRLAIAGVLALAAIVYLLLRLGSAGGGSPQERWSRALDGLPPARLNVVLITVDTLRADRVSAYGSARVATPAMDRLAAEGVRFTDAATTVPFTLPAHSSLMTGTYPPRHGVRENVGYVLEESLPTLAERLAAGGWDTAGFVSAFVLDSRWGIARGFETYFDDFELGEQKANLGAVQRDGAETVAEAVGWLDGRSGAGAASPFFLWVHLFDPHDPYTPPEPYRSRYRHPYDAEVAYADSLVGELRRALETRGLLGSTLVVLTADHGEGLGQHGEGFHGFFVYDSTVHVPLIVRLPGGGFGGRTVTDTVSHVDLLPTILEAAGQTIPEGVHGRSLLPLLVAGEAAAPEAEERAVYTESLYPLLHYGWAPLRAVRRGGFKLIQAPRPELYDLAADPEESLNLVDDRRPVTRELLDRLESLRARIESGEGAAAGKAELDPETVQKLQALGYVAGQGGVRPEEEGDRERADPKDRVALHQAVMRAQSDLGAGELDQAVARLERALKSDPTIVDAHQMLGTIALEREAPAEAVPHFQRVLELRSDHPAALFGLAEAYRRQGRDEEALLGYERILAADPGEPRALLAASDVLVEQGRRGEAIERLSRATSGADARPGLLNRLGELLVAGGREEDAAPAFRRAIAAGEEMAEARFNLAALLEEEGSVKEAMRLYEEVIELAPKHYRAQFNLARLHGRQGNLARQQQLYEAAIASEPDFVRGYFYLAKLLMDRGELDRAEQVVRDGIARDPERRGGPLGHYVLADILTRTGRRAEAARAAREGRRIEAQEAASPSG